MELQMKDPIKTSSTMTELAENETCKSPDETGGGFSKRQMSESASKIRSLNYRKINNSAGRPHICDHCEKTFKRREHLVVHQRVHTGERPYTCDHCEKRFKLNGALTVHQRVHTGERPYTCDHCEKRFKQRVHLVVHQRIHTGEKPYFCDLCNKRFRQITHLKTHQQGFPHWKKALLQ